LVRIETNSASSLKKKGIMGYVKAKKRERNKGKSSPCEILGTPGNHFEKGRKVFREDRRATSDGLLVVNTKTDGIKGNHLVGDCFRGTDNDDIQHACKGEREKEQAHIRCLKTLERRHCKLALGRTQPPRSDSGRTEPGQQRGFHLACHWRCFCCTRV